jgi:subtilisin family serine protease
VTGSLKPVQDAIAYAWSKGAVIVAAAGNDGLPICEEPAATPNVLCVGSIDRSELKSYFSDSDGTLTKNYLVAPGGDGLSCGGDVLSTYLRSATPSCPGDAGYDSISGTSMAAPFVSGVAALLAQMKLTNLEILSCLKTTARDLGVPGRDPIYGHGLVDALRAVTTC